MNWRIISITAIFVVPLIVVLAMGFNQNPQEVPFVLTGAPATDFSLTSLDGDKVTLSSFKGKPVILNFWATWCEPCKYEHEILQRASLNYRDDIVVLGIIYQDDPARAKNYLSSKSNHYPQLIDEKSRVAIDYGVSGVPESFFIDSAGKIVHKEAGVVTPNTLSKQIATLLKGKTDE